MNITPTVPAFRPAGLFMSFALLLGSLMAVTGPLAADSNACTAEGVCVTVTDVPDPVAPSSSDAPTYIAYRATITNTSRHEQKKTRLIEVLPEGSTFVPSGSSPGCVAEGRKVDCYIGRLHEGESATRDVVATAPTTQGPAVNTVTIMHHKFKTEDITSASVTETTTVNDQSGATYVPAGSEASVSTPPDLNQGGTVTIFPQTFSTTAKMSFDLPGQGPAFTCLFGQVTIQGSLYPCRSGNWVLAEVPGTFTPPLEFTLRWSRALSSVLQTEDNFAVFYAPTADSPVQAISERCTGQPAQNTPCLKNITREADGGWSVVMVKPENGHMR